MPNGLPPVLGPTSFPARARATSHTGCFATGRLIEGRPQLELWPSVVFHGFRPRNIGRLLNFVNDIPSLLPRIVLVGNVVIKDAIPQTNAHEFGRT
ncbi:MAG: hypothetical protein ACK5LQ_14915 [Planctomycetota bacterium]|jgi:hypothetical protein